jgi:hypothetical protein
MRNYVKIIKEIRNIKEFSKKKKNRIIRNALLTEIVNVWKPILKLPFTIVGITFAIVCALFENIAEVLELIESVFECICYKIETLPIIKFGDEEENKETIKIIREKQMKKTFVK